jgi:hypothetical protein
LEKSQATSAGRVLLRPGLLYFESHLISKN